MIKNIRIIFKVIFYIIKIPVQHYILGKKIPKEYYDVIRRVVQKIKNVTIIKFIINIFKVSFYIARFTFRHYILWKEFSKKNDSIELRQLEYVSNNPFALDYEEYENKIRQISGRGLLYEPRLGINQKEECGSVVKLSELGERRLKKGKAMKSPIKRFIYTYIDSLLH